MKKYLTASALVVSLLCLPSLLSAENNRNGISQSTQQCAASLQECFAMEGTAQANCLYSVSRHPFCHGTQLGRLIFKRWAISPFRLAETNDVTALNSSQRANQHCFAETDSFWAASISGGQLTEEILSSIGARLDACLEATQLQLPRP